MEFAKIKTQYVGGVDLHSSTMYLCIMDKQGNILTHRNMRNDFQLFNSLVLKYKPDISVGAESMHSYYWLADGCIQEDIPFYLGHAYYMKSIHGGKKKNDKIDSKKIADLMRSNLLPVGYVYPKDMRSARDLLRRRTRFMKIRAEAYAHIQTIFRQHCMNISPEDVKNKATRRKLIDRMSDQYLQRNIEMNLDLIDFFDPKLNKIEREIRAEAK